MFFYTFLPKILNMSLTASVAILFVLLLRLLLKKAPKVTSYALWGVVLFRLLCPVSIESGLSLFGLLDTPTVGISERTSTVAYIPANIVHTEFPEVVLPMPGIGEVITEALPQGEEQLVADPLEAPMTIATYVWVVGILAMAIYGFMTFLRLRRALVTASPLRDNIYLADEISSPFVMGLFRPKIYLPSEMEEREQTYIILHEQYHIRRLDHIVKALAFAALCIHWFNPLVWAAFILSGKDMEMSCDEAVVRKLGTQIRADYTASLLSLATGKRIIAGMPLAFGEGDTKSRIKNLANWKKPAFWVVLVAAIACIVLAICLLTNPPVEREFAINGHNVSELDTERIIEKIAAAENLEDGSLLCVNAGNFDLMFTPDFNWANDGAIRFFYMKNQKTYSAQLRMFHDDNKYFITDTEEWIEQELIFKLFHYLDALKYMPQEEIHQLSPDADGYSVMQVDHGGPGDFDRVLTYSPEGAVELDGWYIHLTVQPLHKVDGGAYNGSGDEVIHLFYGGDKKNDASMQIDEMIPGTTYVSRQCLYMNPLSSYAAVGGDSGCKYVVGDNYFATYRRNGGRVVSVTTRPNLDTADSGLQNMVDIPNWEWQEFPYTDEEWTDLYQPSTSNDFHISEIYDEILYQPLTAGTFLLRVDGDLWLVELRSNEQMGTYLWSIYSLVSESAMGVAQWELTNYNSRLPVFRFAFDLDYDGISAVCTESDLVDLEADGAPPGSSMMLEEGDALYWSPWNEDGMIVPYAEIHFSVHKDGIPTYSGTIYIESTGGDNRSYPVYTASLVGTGLHLSPNTASEGGVISAVNASVGTPSLVTEHDLRTGGLEIDVEDLDQYVFFTNSTKIAIEVKSASDFEGEIVLHDISQSGDGILFAKVDTKDNEALFSNLTSARMYRLSCEELDGCTLIITEK